jgi:GntR family transcriptional regulator/MocR family aminotransferase
VAPSDLLVTRGSQMALYLIARVLIRPGDVVAVEDPGYFSAWDVFTAAGARLLPIPVDGSGLRVEVLGERLRRQAVRAVFLTPHHQFPTTVVLSAGRRLELLQLARSHRFAVIEDDYDHEFHYDGRPVQPLAASDEGGVVLYVGSLSKVLAPGLRSGYLVAPAPMLRPLRELRELIDLQTDLAIDLPLAQLFEDGELQRHLHRARRVYHARRDCLADALARQLKGAVDFTVPSGGMAIWVQVAKEIDLEEWGERARARGICFRTGGVFFFREARQPFLRLGFARLDEQQLQRAVGEIARALPARRR